MIYINKEWQKGSSMTALTGVTLFFRQKIQTSRYRRAQNSRISPPFSKKTDQYNLDHNCCESITDRVSVVKHNSGPHLALPVSFIYNVKN